MSPTVMAGLDNGVPNNPAVVKHARQGVVRALSAVFHQVDKNCTGVDTVRIWF
ncbi:hypothetical protein OG558_35800 [Kribbella sp. NBC_01510]|uniref:hypothetical protein n=1 Tax=Kribbella sp. NBC_01510 TaxID=2903581 RepID=UPI00386A1665